MVKLLVSLFIFLFPFTSFSQFKNADFREVDYAVQYIQSSSVDSLAIKLTTPYNTELEKVRSIFRWVAENIAYNSKIFIKPSRTSSKKIVTVEEDTSTVYKTLNERVAEEVLKKRVAVCDGYSKLFKTLCDKAGIKSEIVTGYGRGDINRPGKKFKSNHAWNAVFIDSSWHLLDVTWASGYFLFNSNDFVKDFDDYYFLTPPEKFIQTHYPEDPQWTLLTNPPTFKEFEFSPFKHMAFNKYKISSYMPLNGVVDTKLGDTLVFELETAKADDDLKIAPDYYFDSSIFSLSPAWAFLKPKNTVSKRKVHYVYIVDSPVKEWLHLVYNDDVIMQYKLNIRKQDQPVALKKNILVND